MILSVEELQTLTKRKMNSAQARELRALGVPFRKRTDGTIVVFRRDVEHAPTQTQPTPPALCFPAPRRVLPGKAGQVESTRKQSA
jgi:hypothetical protein